MLLTNDMRFSLAMTDLVSGGHMSHHGERVAMYREHSLGSAPEMWPFMIWPDAKDAAMDVRCSWTPCSIDNEARDGLG